jgi:propionyl-CoA carboxylase alpha chain
VRIDHGVAEGGEISRYYDPMIAKLITCGSTRAAAIAAQVDALDAFDIAGPATNIDFLSALMQHPRFKAGDLSTGFIAEEYPAGFQGAPASEAFVRGLVGLAVLLVSVRIRVAVPQDWTVRIGSQDFAISLTDAGVVVDGTLVAIDHDHVPGATLVRAMIDGSLLSVQVARTRLGITLRTRGARYEARVLPARIAAYARHLAQSNTDAKMKQIASPMSGLLVRLDVREGDMLDAGQAVAVIEAMKMENVVRAEQKGTVKTIRAWAGESVAVDQVLIDLA